MTDTEYNIYNEFDPKFINYAALYRTPIEMDKNTKDLIDDYANALITGNSDVYKNTPELVGNRYFIDTKTECLDMNDDSRTEVHPRSVLVDNVKESALNTSTDGNTGLLYSLYASLKTLNTENMFNNKNNEPISYIKKFSTDYLENIDQKPLPMCKEVKVYTTDDKTNEITGWVTEPDYNNIDPDAIVKNESVQEGMVGYKVEDNWDPNRPLMENVRDTQDGAAAYAQANAEATEESLENTTTSAQATAAQGGGEAAKYSSAQTDYSKSAQQSQTEQGLAAFKSAKQQGMSQQLINDTDKFLEENANKTTLELLRDLINMKYICGKGSDSSELRIPGVCISAIFGDISNDNINSIDAGRSDLCDPGQTFNTISLKSFVDTVIKSVNENKNNNNNINLPGLPNPTVCIYSVEEKKSSFLFGLRTQKVRKEVESQDYKKYVELIEKYRRQIAQEIVRYTNVGFYGHCPATEGFQNFEVIKQTNYIDYTAYIYMICLLFIFFYILYRLMYRVFNFDRYIRKNKKNNK